MGSEAAMQNHFHSHLEPLTMLGRVGPATFWVTAGIAVEGSPEIPGGELADAAEPSAYVTDQMS